MSGCNCPKGGNGLKTLTLVVEGLSCEHCKKTVEEAVRKLIGVKEAQVYLEKGLLVVTYDPTRVSLAEIQDAIVNAGYRARLSGENATS